MANELRDLTASELRKLESIATVLQQVVRGLLGQSGNGIPIVADQHTGTSAANTFGSADTTNGIGLKGISQDGKYHQISNTGFTVSAPTAITGNTTITGTLDVTGNFAVNTNKFTVAASTGNTLVAGTLDVTGDFKVNTNKFVVTASSGNTTVAGTLGVTGDFSVNTNKFTVAASSGNTVVAGTLGVTGDFAVNTSKFTVTASTGATVIAGNITHDTTLMVTDVTNDKVSFGATVATTAAMVQSTGVIQVISNTGGPSGTAGIDMAFSASTGFLNARNGSGTWYDLAVRGLSVDLQASGTSRFKVNGTGIGFFATTPVAQQADPAAVTGTADATYSANEVTLINDLKTAVNDIRDVLLAYGLTA